MLEAVAVSWSAAERYATSAEVIWLVVNTSWSGNRSFKHVYICCRRLRPVAIPQSAGSAALVLEWHSGRSEKFPCNPRDSGVVCLTQQPLTG